MTRIALAAILLTATAAHANDHWSDLDGDGLLEPDEFGLEGPSFEDIDANNDGVISGGEYDAFLLLTADDGIAIPEEVLPGEDGLEASRVDATEVEPKIISVDE
ncbi:hypothetical protein [Jannaschia formosa]|uniref:hypothetical protein n=1 Tax=Jannaschia formosa TaxID=2259592 RepID=UPI0014313683|nr:hypothetical protein [Jannaschia formosa]